MLDPLHLRTLTTVLHTGSFAVAARQPGYTPSAVSLAARGQEVLSALGVLQDDRRAFAEGVLGTVRLGSFPTQRLCAGAGLEREDGRSAIHRGVQVGRGTER